MPERSCDTEVEETNQSGFDPAGVKNLLDVDETRQRCARDGEAQGVHEADSLGVGTPSGNRPGKGRVVEKMCGGNASVNEVLESLKAQDAREMGR